MNRKSLETKQFQSFETSPSYFSDYLVNDSVCLSGV